MDRFDVEPNVVEYGFILEGRLLHLMKDDDGISDLTTPSNKRPYKATLGEWVTPDLQGILHMYYHPSGFLGRNLKNPHSSYGRAIPVAVYTWYEGACLQEVRGPMHKSYIPLTLPMQISSKDLVGSTEVHHRHTGTPPSRRGHTYRGRGGVPTQVGVRTLYTYKGGMLAIGGLYCSIEPDHITVYECIACLKCEGGRAGYEHLLLALNKEELAIRLVPYTTP